MESHQLSEQYYTYYQEAMNQVKSANQNAQNYKDKIRYYVRHLHSAQEELKSCRPKNTTVTVPSAEESNREPMEESNKTQTEEGVDVTSNKAGDVGDEEAVTMATDVNMVEIKNGGVSLSALHENITPFTNRTIVIHDDVTSDTTDDVTTTERPVVRNMVPAQKGRPLEKRDWDGGVGAGNMATPLSKPTDGGYVVQNRPTDAGGYVVNNHLVEGRYKQNTADGEGSYGAGKSDTETDEEKHRNNEERSGTNIELNDLLDNKPLYMPVHAQQQNGGLMGHAHNGGLMGRRPIAQGDVDNKDIREINLPDDGDVNSNSSPF